MELHEYKERDNLSRLPLSQICAEIDSMRKEVYNINRMIRENFSDEEQLIMLHEQNKQHRIRLYWYRKEYHRRVELIEAPAIYQRLNNTPGTKTGFDTVFTHAQ